MRVQGTSGGPDYVTLLWVPASLYVLRSAFPAPFFLYYKVHPPPLSRRTTTPLTPLYVLQSACLENFLRQISLDGEHTDQTRARRKEDEDHLNLLRCAADKGVGRNYPIPEQKRGVRNGR